ncbi:MAG TPA: hypothetical protein VG435_08735 [Acidimicrobiales bacterium]|nr:hypothetical protein [Acidimicrobiales bacterium]
MDEYSMDPGQDNDPHVDCGFSVSFFGYDGGPQSATIAVTPWAPTSGGRSYSTSTGWNVGTRTSGNQFDRNVQVSGADLASSLAGVTPQPKQGYHLRLEVEVTGSQGSDDKYKVFWMTPCAEASSTSAGAGSSAATPVGPAATSSSAAGIEATTTSTPAANGAESATKSSARSASKSAASAPGTVASSAVPGSSAAVAASTPLGATPLGSIGNSTPAVVPTATAQSSSGSLAFTGADIGALTAIGLGLIGAGLLLSRRWRRASA